METAATAESLQWLEGLATASFLWGPFFFSILFMLVITRIAHVYYEGVSRRAEPPALPEEKRTYRMFFMAAVVCGIILVFVSVGWWIYAQLNRHTFEGTIIGLSLDQQIVATEDDLYYRETMRNERSAHPVRDYHFAIVRNTPFVSGQVFSLNFYPTAGSIGPDKPQPVDLKLRYQGSGPQKFVVRPDGGSFQLVSTSAKAASGSVR
jgi:hypothetical protein